jgi:DNA-binding NtrC family response regulator
MQQSQAKQQRPYPSILIVDDDDAILSAQQRWMQRAFPGSRIIAAADPSSAIAALSSDEFDAVVTELEFRGTMQTGNDIVLWIRSQRPQLIHRVMFLTARPDLVPPNTQNVASKGSLSDLRAMRARLAALLPW